MIKIWSVLRSGGDYDEDYVYRLASMVKRHFKVPFSFHCLTDMDVPEYGIPLINDWPKWWPKLELFRSDLVHDDLNIYFDLDTVIMSDISTLSTVPKDFYMLIGFRCCWASGVLAWRGDHSYIYDLYKNSPTKGRNRGEVNDQNWISRRALRHGTEISAIQSVVPQLYSYAHHCKKIGPPSDAKIVCFHGRPRPRAAARTINWVKENWK